MLHDPVEVQGEILDLIVMPRGDAGRKITCGHARRGIAQGDDRRGEPACDVGRQRRELGKRDLMMVCREGRGSLGGELTQGTKVQVASMTGQSRCRRRAKVRDTVNPQSACRAGDSRSDLGR